MDNDNIKEAFIRVKEDIFLLGAEIDKIKLGLGELKSQIKILTQFTDDLRIKMMNFDEIVKNRDFQNAKNQHFEQQNIPTTTQITPKILSNAQAQEGNKSTNQQINPTQEDIPTDKLLSQVLRRQKTSFSTGNEGVPTDRQTDKQTDRHIIQHIKIEEKPLIISSQTPQITSLQTLQIPIKKDINHLEKVSEILSSLDSLKKDIRRKFKSLTTQEIAVFSTIYTLEEQNEVDYKLLATTLKLSESSIRDYISKIQAKGIPIIKEKINNKLVVLKISPELRKIASLDTILKLREL